MTEVKELKLKLQEAHKFIDKMDKDHGDVIEIKNRHIDCARAQVRRLEREAKKDNRVIMIENLKAENTLFEREAYLYRLGFFGMLVFGVTYFAMHFFGAA